MAKSNFTEEELKHDALIDASSKSIEYIQNNRQSIIIAIVAVVVLVAGGLVYNYWSHQTEMKAQQLLAKAEALYENENFEGALYGDDISFVMGFEEIRENYGSTKAGNLAAYYSAVCAFELGEVDKALENIQNFDNPSGILGVSPLNLYATILEQQESYEAAAKKYEEAAKWVKNETTTPYNLLEAAEAYQAAGNATKAIELLEEIVEEYEVSTQFATAKKLIGQLNG